MRKKLSRRVKKELGITVSIGISWNKIFAKLGSDYKKKRTNYGTDATSGIRILLINRTYRNMVFELPANGWDDSPVALVTVRQHREIWNVIRMYRLF